MAFDGDHLLKRLQPVVRPCGPEFRPRGSDVGGADFAALVAMASRGELASGRPVQQPRNSRLEQGHLDRLSTACDAFEAAGMQHGIVLMDSRAFQLEVAGRTLIGELGPEDVGKVTDTEGVIRLDGPDASASEEAFDAPGPRIRAIPAVPPGVLTQLERAPGRQTG